MKRKFVESSMFASIGYDKKRNVLELEFNHGRIYQYYDVPQTIYKEIMGTSSKGRYFLANIEDCYEYARIS